MNFLKNLFRFIQPNPYENLPTTTTCYKLKTKGTPPSVRYAHSMIYCKYFTLLWGGYNWSSNVYFNDVYIFNFDDHSWKKVEIKGDVPPRIGCHRCVWYNDAMWSYGGYNGETLHIMDTFFCFNVKEGQFKRITSENEELKPSARSHHISLLWKDHLLIYGGFCGQEDTNLYLYNFKTRQWSRKQTSGDVPASVEKAGGEIVQDMLYTYGGNTDWYESTVLNQFLCLNLRTAQWQKLNVDSSIIPRYMHSTISYGNNLYIFGGTTSYKFQFVKNDLCEYNLMTRKWKVIETPIPKRFGHTVCIHDHKMYIFCGADTENHYNDVYVYQLPRNHSLNIMDVLKKSKFCDIVIITKI